MIRKLNFLFCEQSQRDAFEAAIAQMVDVIQTESSIREWVWLIPQMAQLEGDSFTRAVSPGLIKGLARGERLPYDSSSIQLKTKQTWSRTSNVDGVIAFYADQDMMDLVDENGIAKVVIAVPYAPRDIESWCKAWQPVVPNGVIDGIKTFVDPVVDAALSELTNIVNVGRSVLHPGDAESVSDVFKILRANGHSPEPSDIRAWCVGHGWRPTAADEAMKRATKVFAANAVAKPKPTTLSASLYDRWRQP